MIRRDFIRLSATAGLLLSAACAPAARPSSSPNATAGVPSGGAKASPFPTYIPLANGPKPDYHTDDPRYDDGFDAYPASPIKAVAEKPGAGGTVNILNRAYFPPPTPFDQNPTWQEVNRQINATMAINVVGGPDYQTKFVTTMAGDDLPDIMHIYNGYALAPNLQGFFKAKCADLTPYLGGDAARDYPYLAAIPTYAWKNSVSAIDGALYLVPIQRHLPTFPAIPYRLVAYSAARPDGTWRRYAAYPEIGCVSEADTPWEAQAQLEELRIRYIIDRVQRGEPIPVPRPPLKSLAPMLDLERLGFAKWLVDHEHLSEDK